MNICKLVLECINSYQEDEPIFIEDVKNMFLTIAKIQTKKKLQKMSMLF